jgi:hypothetical protein
MLALLVYNTLGQSEVNQVNLVGIAASYYYVFQLQIIVDVVNRV